jgi:acyl transferase domain-containing protein/acyl carrier protein
VADERKLSEYLRRVTADLRKTRGRLRTFEARASEPIAIVGIGCRYPGDVRSADDLWDLVSAEVDAVGAFPTDRGWDLEGLFDPDPDSPATSYALEAAFLYDAADFDAAFFGVSPREALATDPQQRLALEVCWEALENAGLDPQSLMGSRTGVFIGAIHSGYGVGARGSVEGVEGYGLTGTMMSVVSGRVAYLLGLEGPALTVDTACSSSLVALHLACQSLRQGECEFALAGGVTIMPTPDVFIEFSRQRGLAPDGRCKAFAAAADGTGWAEGVGVLALERLSEAQRFGHQVLGVIRGSAVNQDGASNGLTAPNGSSQRRVIREALAAAQLVPTDVDAVEAHGTGTTLGDPIEAQALLAAYGRRPADNPLWLGSIKSNIGHASAAAGVAGVIKMVMAMRHGMLPKTLHVDEPSKQVDWSEGAVSLLTKPRPWPAREAPRRAGVSGFGVSGTNVHVILEQAPPEPERMPAADTTVSPSARTGTLTDAITPWVISGRGADAQRAQAERLVTHVMKASELHMGDVGLSLARRSMFADRAVVFGADRQELLAGARALARGDSAANVVRGAGSGDGDVVFLFPGQGSQWVGMARELLYDSQLFAEHMSVCADALAPFVEWSLLDVLTGVEGAPGLERVDVVQPALFAVMVSLAKLWQECGVHPAAVVGHSQGEIVAAHIAGALSLSDAAQVVASRSRVLRGLDGSGGMVSLALGAEELGPLLDRWGDRVCLAAVNGPRSLVVAGDIQALDELLRGCAAQDIRARKIDVTYAAHSSQIDAVRDELLQGLAGITVHPSEIPFFSTVTGGPIDTARLDGDYWYRNLREPVQLEPVVRMLLADGRRSFVEVSPHPILTSAVQEVADESRVAPAEVHVTGSLRRGEGGAERFQKSLAEAFVHGADVAWTEVFAASDARPVPLPTYAFQRRRYWLDARSGAGGSVREAGLCPTDHLLLGAGLMLAEDRSWLFTGQLSLQTHPWLSDHAVMGVVLLPGAALVELALYAGAHLDCRQVEEMVLEVPLVLCERGATQIQISIGEADASGARVMSIHSRAVDSTLNESELNQGSWVQNAKGVLAPGAGDGAQAETLDERKGESLGRTWPPEGAIEVDVDDVYRRLTERGFDYGPAFQCLRAAWRYGGETFAEVSLPLERRAEARRFGLHPALFDAALHAGIGMFDLDAAEPMASVDGAFLPFSWNGVRLAQTGVSSLRVRLSPVGSNAMALTLCDENGADVASVRSLAMRTVSVEQLGEQHMDPEDSLFCVGWTPVSSAGHRVAESIVVLDERGSSGGSAAWLDLDVYKDLRALEGAIDAGLEVPAMVLVDWTGKCGAGLPPQAAHANVKRTLELAQAWIAGERYVDARLVLLTSGAVCTGVCDPVIDPAVTAVWGLIRSAVSEHPGRFGLIDLDAEQASWDLLRVALDVKEPQLAVRGGKLLVPRLKPISDDHPVREDEPTLNLQGTVLITGGTGKLGSIVARHLVSHHRARSVMLISRSGREADGAAELERSLLELGARVAVEACDVNDRKQLAALIESIPQELPLCAVVHAAGLIDDGVIESLTPDRVDRVLEPKADAAWHLHELTRELDLSAFVLFSSAAGLLGAPGQGNYAAANAFLDGLAVERRAADLPATSIAWGLWAQASGLTAGLAGVDVTRMRRAGVRAMSTDDGLRRFDAACLVARAEVVALSLDTVALRARATEPPPPLLRGFVRATPQRVSGPSVRSFSERLRETSAVQQPKVALEAVSQEVAIVLGHTSPSSIESQCSFKELGFDSLTAVELRNRLAELTGLRLAATLVFDYPTPASLAAHLLEEIEVIRVDVGAARSALPHTNEPIAIVGMGCRYPGGVSSPEDLWALLVGGGDAMSSFPEDRGWDLDALHTPDPDRDDMSYAREGGFLYDACEFDRAFFGIAPGEALAMDPQQRLMLEVCWETVESAGIDPTHLRGSATGVFAGVMYHDYVASIYAHAPSSVRGHLGVGSAASVVSGRVAYALGLEGPALTVDTACSSSLVTLHLACQALRTGECEMALAGGVTVLSTPAVFLEFGLQGGLAPDGRCKSFADVADGAAFSEGVGVLMLERLSDARRLDHRVLAVVRGSAVNQDGTSNGLTAPNGPSQQRVIREALANAGLLPQQVDAVEAHGTGTTLGDPIEAQGLLATYGQGRGDAEGCAPLWLGSVKSNIGHTQAAAGVAGVIKMVLALLNDVLPRTLHVDEPSRQVDWSVGAVSLLTEHVPWVGGREPRRAGVSSFGISGTNAHVILEEAPVPIASAGSAVAGLVGVGADVLGGEPDAGGRVFVGARKDGLVSEFALWPLSGRGAAALRAQALRLQEYVHHNSELDVADVGFSLACKPVFADRAVVLGRSREQLLSGLDSLARGESGPQVVAGVGGGAEGDGPVWIFPGQGSQWVGMAVDLLECSPVFRQRFLDCQDALAPFVDWSLEDVLRAKPGALALERVDVVQPALFAVMVSLAELWRACGVTPAAVVGHSQGEIAAAYVAGGLSLEDAARIIALRSRALTALAGHGGMVSVVLGVNELARVLRTCDSSLAVAAVNGPSSVVVSGVAEALAEVLDMCEREGIRARRIPVDYAAHSEAVEALCDELLMGCEPVRPRSGNVPFYSTVSGELMNTVELDAQYWYRNLRETVQLERVMRTLLAQGYTTFIEVSPHPVLTVAVQETADEELDDSKQVAIVGSLRREQDGRESFSRALGEAWVQGAEVDWRAVLNDDEVERVDLPRYAFQRERYWLARDGGAVGNMSAVGLVGADHPLLGAAVSFADREGWLFTGRLSLDTHSWLADYAAMGVVLLPATAFLELALYVGAQVGCDVVDELTLQAPLVLPDRDGVTLQISVSAPDDAGRRTLTIHSCLEDNSTEGEPLERGWTRNATGLLAGSTVGLSASNGHMQAPVSVRPPQHAESIEPGRLYEQLEELGFDYGPVFQGVRAAWRWGDELFVKVTLPEDQHAPSSSFCVHPALLDAVLQPALSELRNGSGDEGEQGDDKTLERMHLPMSFRGVRLHAAGSQSLWACLRRNEDGTLVVTVADESGELVASIDSLLTKAISHTEIASLRREDPGLLFNLKWTAMRSGLHSPAGSVEPNGWALLGHEDSPVAGGLRDIGMSVATYSGIPALGEAIQAGAPLPEMVLIDAVREGQEQLVGAAREVLHDVLHALQELLSNEGFAASRLVVITRDALAIQPGEDVEGLASAAVWGLVRSAQSESPGCLMLVDVDGREPSWQALPPAVLAAFERGELQLAIRDGVALAPRLTPFSLGGESSHRLGAGQWLNPECSVLITGGTGGLGSVLARHLVAEHGAHSLILASRRGADAPGALELQGELEAQGACVTLVACDVSEREQLAALIQSVPQQHPLGAVIHAAGIIEDGVIGSLTVERLERVLAPKLDAAWHLHELTEHLNLTAFVLFSSAAGTLGNPGQANYAAANAFLDALAAYRLARGLVGTSIAWGLWAQGTGLTGALNDDDLTRIGRLGMKALSSEESLALLDAACVSDEALLLPMSLDVALLRVQARSEGLPALLRDLVSVPARRVGTNGASLIRRLASLSATQRRAAITEMIQREIEMVLGAAPPGRMGPERAFKDLGFTSLTAVELRNRLNAATGFRLPSTLVFDYPTPDVLAGYLLEQVSQMTGDGNNEAQKLRQAIASIPLSRLQEAGLIEVLLKLANTDDHEIHVRDGDDDVLEIIDSMDVDSLVHSALDKTVTG